MLSFFPRGVLDEILNLIESVSEGFPSYSYSKMGKHRYEKTTENCGRRVYRKKKFTLSCGVQEKQQRAENLKVQGHAKELESVKKEVNTKQGYGNNREVHYDLICCVVVYSCGHVWTVS